MNEGLIGQLFGQNLQAFPESTCQTEYMDILGGDMNDGRLPGQRTRSLQRLNLAKLSTLILSIFSLSKVAQTVSETVPGHQGV